MESLCLGIFVFNPMVLTYDKMVTQHSNNYLGLVESIYLGIVYSGSKSGQLLEILFSCGDSLMAFCTSYVIV